MATGHEERFRLLFGQEAEPRLARLADGLLELEERGAEPDLVAALFREAHTLKGGAAVVGLPDVARVSHALEDVLDELREHRREVDPALVDRLLGVVDGLRGLVADALAGRPHADAADALVALVVDAARDGSAAAASGHGPTTNPGPPAPNRPLTPPAAEPLLPSFPPRSAPPQPPGEQAQDEAAGDGVHVPIGRLDELGRLVTEAAATHLRLGRIIAEGLDRDPLDVPEYRELARTLDQLQDRAMRTRMVPIARIVEPLRRAVRDVARASNKQVHFTVRGRDTAIDRGVLDHITDPLLHIVRNAVDHGIEPPEERVAAGKPADGEVRLHAMQLGGEVVIAVADDGGGIDRARVTAAARARGVDLGDHGDSAVHEAIFAAGVSTAATVTDVSGRGVGLDVVREALDRVRGRIEVHSSAGVGTEFRIVVPLTLSVLPCVLVAVAGRTFALPMHAVVAVVPASRNESGRLGVASAGGRPLLWHDGRSIPLSALADVLGIPAPAAPRDGPALLVAGLSGVHAFQLDGVLGQRRVVVKGLGPLLPRLPVIAGASAEPDGSVLLVLDPQGLIDAARELPVPSAGVAAKTGERAHVLVVDDALAVRELQRSILQRAGYDVRVASDGEEALALLAERGADLVLTDIEMPRMDGLQLTRAIRSRPALAGLPVVVLTSRASEEDRLAGLAAGADAYIVKSSFDAAALLSVVARLLGDAP